MLAYVDDLLVVGTDEIRKSFMSQLSEEVCSKPFLGRRLTYNGDSIDARVSQAYVDSTLELYGMKNAKSVATTDTATNVKTVPDTATELSGAFNVPDCSW